jgi:hypothetical protein
MNDSKSEKDYFKLLSSGMFWEIYPQLTGEWEKDKDEFIKNENWLNENFRKMNNSTERFEPLKEIKIEPKANLLPSQPIERKGSIVTPILVVYLDVSRVDNIQEAYDHVEKEMEKFKKYGWVYMIIGIDDGRNSFIESHSVERLDPIELKRLETKILETIKTGE